MEPRLDIQGGEHGGIANGVNDVLASGEGVNRGVGAVVDIRYIGTGAVVLPTLALLH